MALAAAIIKIMSDTSPDADEAQLECIRRLTPQERLRKMATSSRRGRDLAMATIRRGEPEISEVEVRLRYLALAYGDELAADVRRWLGDRGSRVISTISLPRSRRSSPPCVALA